MNAAGDLLLRDEILIKASRDRVFHALTNPEDITTWWRLPGLYAVDEARIDLREGGEFSFAGTNSNKGRFLLTGVFLVVDPPRRLQYTWVPDWNDEARHSIVEFRLKAVGDHTRLLLTHSAFLSGAACEEHRHGWPAVLCSFAEYLER